MNLEEFIENQLDVFCLDKYENQIWGSFIKGIAKEVFEATKQACAEKAALVTYEDYEVIIDKPAILNIKQEDLKF